MGKKRKTSRNSKSVKINSSSPFSVLNSECTRILDEAEKGNSLQAVNLMIELRSKYENSQYESYVYRVQGTVFFIVSCRSNDLNDKERYRRNAIESGKRALELSPNTIEYSLFYANLLYEVAKEFREYEEVIRVCERALMIEDVVDPIEGSSEHEVQSRVCWIQNHICILIQKSNVSLFSTLMRDLENDGENFDSMPIRRIVDEKTVDYQMASTLCSLKHTPVNNSSHTNSGSLEKGKHGNVTRIVSPVEMIKWVKPFWESMSLDRKRDFFKVKIADLQEHIMSLKDQLPSNLIVEALSFCKENQAWQFMVCCFCNKKCSDTEAFRKHIDRVHLGSLSVEQLLAFPNFVGNDWVAMICDGSWEPLDLKAAARVMEERPSDFVDKKSLLREKWPVAFDTQRAELLGKIQTKLDCHVKLQCLSESHINSISDYVVKGLQNHPQLMRLNVHQTHLGLCFLGARELSNILTVLQEIADSCERNTYSGVSSANSNLALDALMERIAFSQEDSVVVSIRELSSDNSPETEVLLLLMYANFSNPEELPSCPPFEYLIEKKAQEGLRIIQQLERDFKRLKVSIEEKIDLLGKQDALPVVEAYLCFLARKKILPETNFQHQILDVESSLRNMKEELVKTGTTASDDRFELNAMRCVLDEVESLGLDEVDDSRVREAIRSQGKRFAVEIRKVDARIMSIHAQRICLLRELASVAKHDFRIIVIPLLKSFLRARLEDLKKVAADELILDCKSNVGSRVDNPKLVSQRKKDSKKKRNRQKNSGPKVITSDNSVDKISKEISPPDDHDEECPDTDCHDLQLQEEELERKLELEADERKLEEALDSQRQMEYEAKQKCLANEHDCSSPAIRREETEIASEGEQLEQALEDNQQTEDGTLQKHHVEQDLEKESCMQNDEFHNIPEGAADNTMDGCTLVFGSVYKGVILTGLEQQPTCGKEPRHDCEPTNSGPKVTNSDNSRDETDVERFLLDEKFPTEMAPDTEYHDLQLEENEKQLQEALEDQRHVEREAKQKSLANGEEVSATEIRQEEVEIASEEEQVQKSLEECSKGQDCLICKKHDHLAKNCPERNTSQYCLKCGDYGHDMLSCREGYCSDDLKQVQCYVCHNYGHLCCVDYGSPRKSQLSCYKCGESGHSGPECCIQNDKFQDTSDGVANSTAVGCTSSNGPVNRGAVLTNNQQQPVREKEPGHHKKESTSLQDSRVDHNGYVTKGTVKGFNNHCQPKAVNVTGPDGAPVQGSTGEYDGGGYGGRRHRGGGRDRCYTCGDSGHIARYCMQHSGGYGGKSGSSGRGWRYTRSGSGYMARDCMQHIGGGGSGRYGGCGGRGDSGAGIPLKKRPETSDAGNEAIIKVNGMDVPERGLRIILVDHNSFPSVIIQSLWHIRRFQDDMQRLSVHAHVDEPFVVCALCDILFAQNTPYVDKETETHPLTVAIREIVSYFFNKGPRDDALEVLEIILAHFHQVLMPSQDEFVTKSVESNCHNSSINMFKLEGIESMTCYHCGLTSGYRKYTSFSHKISANDLGKAKLKFPTYSFDELLNLVGINHHLACRCGALNHIVHFLTTSPHVFTAFIQWQNNSGSCEDIAQILEAICTSIDVRLLYRGLNPGHRHHLVCMVCYHGQHYCCFGYNEKDGKWIIHDDKTTKVVGGWKDVVVMCKAENMKPHVLFFEANTD